MRTRADGKGYPDSDIYPVTSGSGPLCWCPCPRVLSPHCCLYSSLVRGLLNPGHQTCSRPSLGAGHGCWCWRVILSVPQSSLVWYLPIVNLLGLVFTSLYFLQYVMFDENRKCWLCSALTLFSINFLDFPYQVATEVKSSLILNFPRKHYLVLQLQQHMRIMESLQTDHGKSIFHISTLMCCK